MADCTRNTPDQNLETEPEPSFIRSFAFTRAPRHRMLSLVLCRCGESEVEGYTLNISYSGLLVQASDSLPPLGERCEVRVLLPRGELRARGQITRVDEQDGRFAVELTHLAKNGYLLLSAFLAELGTGGRLRIARRL